MFTKAVRRKVKIKIAITGPSGSGKTYSALAMASGLGKKVALIDTENGSASLYADKFDFEVVEIKAPFTVEKHLAAIADAVKAGFDVLVVDTITHVWKGDGGLLAQKTALDMRPGSNSYTNWAGITKQHEKFLAGILHSDIHLIATMRSKQDYILETNEKGKSVPRKVGLAPEQRESMEYEFSVVLDVAMDHSAMVSKDRTGIFSPHPFVIDKATGEMVVQWLGTGAAAEKPASVVPDAKPTLTPKSGGKEGATGHQGPSPAQLKRLFAISRTAGWTDDEVREHMFQKFQKISSSELSWVEYSQLCKHIELSPRKDFDDADELTDDELLPFEK